MDTEVHTLFQYQFSVLLDVYLGVELLGFAFFFFFIDTQVIHILIQAILIQPMKHSSLQLDLFPPFHLPTSRESCLYFLPSFAHSLLFPQLILFCICLYFAPTYILLAEKAMAPHSSTLCLENPMDRGAW